MQALAAGGVLLVADQAGRRAVDAQTRSGRRRRGRSPRAARGERPRAGSRPARARRPTGNHSSRRLCRTSRISPPCRQNTATENARRLAPAALTYRSARRRPAAPCPRGTRARRHRRWTHARPCWRRRPLHRGGGVAAADDRGRAGGGGLRQRLGDGNRPLGVASISNTPTGPFQTMVLAPAAMCEKVATSRGRRRPLPSRRGCRPSATILTAPTVRALEVELVGHHEVGPQLQLVAGVGHQAWARGRAYRSRQSTCRPRSPAP